jgi:type I restriction enzyme S subunit
LKVNHLDTGAANPALNRNLVHPIKVLWPPVTVQRQLIAKFIALSDHSHRVAALYTRKLASIAELKQSLLQKAFSGQLTASESLAA